MDAMDKTDSVHCGACRKEGASSPRMMAPPGWILGLKTSIKELTTETFGGAIRVLACSENCYQVLRKKMKLKHRARIAKVDLAVQDMPVMDYARAIAMAAKDLGHAGPLTLELERFASWQASGLDLKTAARLLITLNAENETAASAASAGHWPPPPPRQS